MRVYRGIANEDVDPSPRLARLSDEVFELRLIGNTGCDSDRLAAFGADRCRHLLAGWRIAGRDHDPPTRFGKRLGDRLADPTARTGNDRHFSGQIEKPHDTSLRLHRCLSIMGDHSVLRKRLRHGGGTLVANGRW